MIKKEQQERIAAVLGIGMDELIRAYSDAQEVEVTLREGDVFTADELAGRDAERWREGRKEGEREAFGIARKEIARHTGLELKAERFGDLGIELRTALNASGDDKIRLLQEQNGRLADEVKGFAGKEAQYKDQIELMGLDNELMGHLPKEVSGFKTSSLLRELKSEIAFEKVDGAYVARRNGQVMTSKDRMPLTVAEVVQCYKSERGWDRAETGAAVTGGRGGMQKAPGGGVPQLRTKSQAEAAWAEANPGKSMMTPEGMAWYQEVSKAQGFNMYE